MGLDGGLADISNLLKSRGKFRGCVHRALEPTAVVTIVAVITVIAVVTAVVSIVSVVAEKAIHEGTEIDVETVLVLANNRRSPSNTLLGAVNSRKEKIEQTVVSVVSFSCNTVVSVVGKVSVLAKQEGLQEFFGSPDVNSIISVASVVVGGLVVDGKFSLGFGECLEASLHALFSFSIIRQISLLAGSSHGINHGIQTVVEFVRSVHKEWSGHLSRVLKAGSVVLKQTSLFESLVDGVGSEELLVVIQSDHFGCCQHQIRKDGLIVLGSTNVTDFEQRHQISGVSGQDARIQIDIFVFLVSKGLVQGNFPHGFLPAGNTLVVALPEAVGGSGFARTVLALQIVEIIARSCVTHGGRTAVLFGRNNDGVGVLLGELQEGLHKGIDRCGSLFSIGRNIQ
mmetsp:Transcript_16860/g.34766  ORF Transcript_16860/g.34766 Transcript_16860/m.34766 type:complete len:397 (+) Transcript_16860:985-2175(+)